jgi:hypothetical protein
MGEAAVVIKLEPADEVAIDMIMAHADRPMCKKSKLKTPSKSSGSDDEEEEDEEEEEEPAIKPKKSYRGDITMAELNEAGLDEDY